MSKTVSARLPKETHDTLREQCNQLGCTMNDFVKESVEKRLNGSSNSIFQNCSQCDEETHKMMDMIAKKIHDSDSISLKEDDLGRPEEAEIVWNYDEKPKATVTLVEE